MKTIARLAVGSILALGSASAFGQATPTPPAPQDAPAAPMQGMMMSPSQAAPGGQTNSQQGGMMECGMMQRSAQMASNMEQMQKHMAEMTVAMKQMQEQMNKTR